MADDREKISTGPNDRPLNETIAGTGPGIPDEALSPDGKLLQPPSEEEEKRMVGELWAKRSNGRGLYLMARKVDDQGRNVREQLLAAIETR